MDGIMQALAKMKPQWKEDLYFTVKFACQMLSKYYTEVTSTTGMLLISAHILDSFRKLQLFRNWNKGLDMIPENKTSHTTQYQEEFLEYVENEYCAKHREWAITKPESVPRNNLFSSAMASSCDQSS
jgi:hypothetical protein